MRRAGIARPGEVVVIHNGIDPRPLPPPARIASKRRELGIGDDAFLVGAVGRLVPQKGHTYLVQAARQVADVLPRTRFVVAGDGPLRDALQHEVAALGLAEHFTLLGQRGDVRELLPALDLFVLPSLWEAMPYTILEAHDAGLPIVASAVCGLDEFLPHGVLTPAKDAASLAAAIVGLARDAATRERLGRLGRALVRERFPHTRCIERLEALYRRGYERVAQKKSPKLKS